MPLSYVQIKSVLCGVEFPASRSELLAHVRAQGAPDEIRDAVASVHDGRPYHDIAQVCANVDPGFLFGVDGR